MQKSFKIPPASRLTAESLSIQSSPSGEVTLQVGSPLILTCEVQGLPPEVGSGLLVQWMRRGSVSSDGVEVRECKSGVSRPTQRRIKASISAVLYISFSNKC